MTCILCFYIFKYIMKNLQHFSISFCFWFRDNLKIRNWNKPTIQNIYLHNLHIILIFYFYECEHTPSKKLLVKKEKNYSVLEFTHLSSHLIFIINSQNKNILSNFCLIRVKCILIYRGIHRKGSFFKNIFLFFALILVWCYCF